MKEDHKIINMINCCKNTHTPQTPKKKIKANLVFVRELYL